MEDIFFYVLVLFHISIVLNENINNKTEIGKMNFEIDPTNDQYRFLTVKYLFSWAIEWMLWYYKLLSQLGKVSNHTCNSSHDGQKFNVKKLHTYSQLDAGMIHYKSLFNDDNHILKEASWIYEYDIRQDLTLLFIIKNTSLKNKSACKMESKPGLLE